jgi:hypothetical protein
MSKNTAIQKALHFLSDNNIKLPDDLHLSLEQKGLLNPYKRKGTKAISSDEYQETIRDLLTEYFEEGGAVTSYKNQFKQAMVEAFGTSFDDGWQEGGQDLPADEDALSWFNERVNQEFGFIDMLFQEAKELRKEEEFNYEQWVDLHSNNYANSLKEVYNEAKLRAMDDIMVTFDGDDGEESCETCTSLKGVRHKISWFVKRNYVPPFGIGLQCGRGGHCNHLLYDDQGNEITI